MPTPNFCLFEIVTQNCCKESHLLQINVKINVKPLLIHGTTFPPKPPPAPPHLVLTTFTDHPAETSVISVLFYNGW